MPKVNKMNIIFLQWYRLSVDFVVWLWVNDVIKERKSFIYINNILREFYEKSKYFSILKGAGMFAVR